MTDRELLELAAKAAGWVLELVPQTHLPGREREMVRFEDGIRRLWSPLTDDGDALRLAVKLKISIECDAISGCGLPLVSAFLPKDLYDEGPNGIAEEYEPDPYAATRRAIVRAAAEIALAAHVCGRQGFGQSLDDQCPACTPVKGDGE